MNEISSIIFYCLCVSVLFLQFPLLYITFYAFSPKVRRQISEQRFSPIFNVFCLIFGFVCAFLISFCIVYYCN